jgi:hypothetical protein
MNIRKTNHPHQLLAAYACGIKTTTWCSKPATLGNFSHAAVSLDLQAGFCRNFKALDRLRQISSVLVQRLRCE